MTDTAGVSGANADIAAILDFWFASRELDGPALDGRMKVWFGSDPVFDAAIRERFGQHLVRAARGELGGWTETPRGRLAVILLLDQFTRNVFRGSARAFIGDAKALQLTLDGLRLGMDQSLSPIERVFFYMPMQHAESRRVQQLSVKAYRGLVAAVDETLAETFQTFAEFAELHADIVERFGRFPHRNAVLGRDSTEDEQAYLEDDAPSFGQ